MYKEEYSTKSAAGGVGPPRENLHTHTRHCKHATGDASDYAARALRAGLEVLGFSDHCPNPENRWDNVRMPMEELDDYVDAVAKARETHPELKILLGMECEHVEEFSAFYREELLGRCGF
ncbi:MAG: PHP domain-containing protein, partial [Planctomycetes bacterium]|nr:PHP domain-containing protein [Planctomycetota bacterium]